MGCGAARLRVAHDLVLAQARGVSKPAKGALVLADFCEIKAESAPLSPLGGTPWGVAALGRVHNIAVRWLFAGCVR